MLALSRTDGLPADGGGALCAAVRLALANQLQQIGATPDDDRDDDADRGAIDWPASENLRVCDSGVNHGDWHNFETGLRNGHGMRDGDNKFNSGVEPASFERGVAV